MSPNTKVVEAYLARADRSTVAALLADDVEWVGWADGVPASGVVKGLEEHRCEVSNDRVAFLRANEVLTNRQEEVVRTAFGRGYFDYPRKTRTAKLAGELGISASTLSEVMRAAQRGMLARYLPA